MNLVLPKVQQLQKAIGAQFTAIFGQVTKILINTFYIIQSTKRYKIFAGNTYFDAAYA